MTKPYIMFLDDERQFEETVCSVFWRERNNLPPFTKDQLKVLDEVYDDFDNMVHVRSCREAFETVTERGYPVMVFFDYDLGYHQATGIDFARWLISKDTENKCLPEGFQYYAHSYDEEMRGKIVKMFNKHLGY